MRKVSQKLIIVVILVVMLSSCSNEIKSSAGPYVPTQQTYDAYDATILSGQQVDNALIRYKESLPIVVVKGGKSYVFGESDETITTLAYDTFAEFQDKENVINKDGSYQSLLLRDNNNKVIAIKVTEWDKSQK